MAKKLVAVLVVSARARSVMMACDCAVMRMMNGGSRAHIVHTHAHTTTGATSLALDRTNERDRDGRSTIDERRATIVDRCARAVWGGAPGRCRLVVCGLIFLLKILFRRMPNARRHRPWGRGGPSFESVLRGGSAGFRRGPRERHGARASRVRVRSTLFHRALHDGRRPVFWC